MYSYIGIDSQLGSPFNGIGDAMVILFNKITLFLVLFIGFNFPGAAVEETIRLTTGEFPPLMQKTLKHYGVLPRIVTEAFAAEGIKVKYGFYPWKRGYLYALEGDWDGAVGWTYTKEREADFYLSNTILKTGKSFFHLKSYPFDWKSFDDLKGIKIGTTIGYSYGEAFDAAEKAGKLETRRAPTDKLNLAKLLLGRIQLFVITTDVGNEILQKEFLSEEAQLITHHPNLVSTIRYQLLLSKKIERNQHMLRLFNNGLKRIREDGKIDQYIAESRRGEYLKK